MTKLKRIVIDIYESGMLFFDFFIIKIIKKHPNVLSFNETILLIQSLNKSVCRFGDGEFAIMNGHNIKFQKHSPALEKKLKKIIATTNDELLISLPDVFLPNPKYTKKTNDYWLKEIAKYRLMLYRLIDRNRKYGNAFISRPYMNWLDKENATDRFTTLFNLWEDKNLLIVEGEKTRMGVGNDIFSKVKSVKRILVPSEDAFSKYQDILDSIMKNYSNELILISAGPTAKILVYELFEKGIQAVDIGHIDLEYEWYLKSVHEKVIIDGKYTSEVNNGELVQEETSSEYLRQIVDNVI